MDEWAFVPLFEDRFQAGNALASVLERFKNDPLLILAIHPGGVPVSVPVAKRLGTALDIVLPHKIPIPSKPEASLGAVTPDGTVILNEPLIAGLDLTQDEIQLLITKTRITAQECEKNIRVDRPFPEPKNKIVLLIDDGLTSSCALIAAAHSIQRYQPIRVILSTPIGSERLLKTVRPHVGDIISLFVCDTPLFAIASFYKQLPDLSDQQIQILLDQSHTGNKDAN